MAAIFSEKTRARLAGAREADEFTDYDFVCEGQRIPVHKIIISIQSLVFRAACNGSFKEASGAYEIKDYSLPMVQRMVDYLYTGQYSAAFEESERDEQGVGLSALIVHARMFALADKYLIDDLQALSAASYSKSLHGRRYPDVYGFFLSIPEVYNSTPASARELRDRAVDFAREKLAGREELKESKEYEKVMAGIPEFADDLLRAFMHQNRELDYKPCDECHQNGRLCVRAVGLGF